MLHSPWYCFQRASFKCNCCQGCTGIRFGGGQTQHFACSTTNSARRTVGVQDCASASWVMEQGSATSNEEADGASHLCMRFILAVLSACRSACAIHRHSDWSLAKAINDGLPLTSCTCLPFHHPPHTPPILSHHPPHTISLSFFF